MFPVFFSFFVVLVHNSIANGCPRRHDITRKNIFVGRMNSFQELFCSGNIDEKIVIKGLLDVVKFLSIKERDATSAMLFWLPLICVVRRGDACMTCCLTASALSRCAAMLDVVVVCLFVQDTVAMLSEKIPTCACFSVDGVIFSRISHASRTPAISRSFIDMVPFGFCFDTKLL